MKKTISLLLTAALLCCLLCAAACSKKAGDETTSGTAAAQTETSATAADNTSDTQPQTQAEEQPSGAPSAAAPENSAPASQGGSEPVQQSPGYYVVDETEAEPAEYVASTGISGGPQVTVSADRAGFLHAGDRFTVTFRISNAVRLVCLSTRMEYNTVLLTAVDAETTGDAGLMDSIHIENGQIRFAGLVMKTTDIDEADLFTVTFAVNQETGTTVTEITTEITQLLTAKDANGDNTQDLTAEFSPAVLTLELQA